MAISKNTVVRVVTVVCAALALLVIVPQTRYLPFRFFIHKDAVLHVQDANGASISDATILAANNAYKTDTNGNVVIKKLAVGTNDIKVSALFYDTLQFTLKQPLFKKPKTERVVLKPVGTITKVSVINRISGRALMGVKVKSPAGGSGVTNAEGTAVISVNTTSQKVTVQVTDDGIVDATSEVKVGGSATDNVVYVTPKGRIAYLQKNDAKIQVIASNIDGTNSQVILDASGNEDPADTQLIGSASWKFAALKARRGTNVGLYIVDVVNSTLTTLDESPQSYIPVGWRNETFIYLAYAKRALWQPGTYTLKAYNALNQQTTVLDESRAEGVSATDFASEVFENVYIVPEGIVYAKKWQASYYYGARLANKRMTITLTDEIGNKKDINQWQAGYNASIKTRQSGPRQLAIFVELDGVNRSYYTYNNSTVVQDRTVDEEVFKKTKQDTYYISPNNLYSVWQTADNKNFVGTVDKTIGSLLPLPSAYKVIGWYSNDYVLLVDTANNDLKITARDVAQKGGSTIKINTIYTAPLAYTVYGYGR